MTDLFRMGRPNRFASINDPSWGTHEQLIGNDNIQPYGWIADGVVSDGSFAASIDPVLLRTTATLTDADAILNPNRVAFNTDDSKLYRSDGATWTKAVDGADIIAASIIAGKIAAGAIGATEIAANAITAQKLVIGIPVEGGNLLKNGSFEVGDPTILVQLPNTVSLTSANAEAITYGWGTTSGLTVPTRFPAGSANTKQGSRICVFTQANGEGTLRLRQDVPVIAGRTYRLTGWHWKSAAGTVTSRLRLSTLDADLALVAFNVAFDDTTSTTPVFADMTYTVPTDGTVSYLRVDLLANTANASGVTETFQWEDIALVEVPNRLANTSGSVVIDGASITIKDEFGATSLGASGFAGSWFDFTQLGLYNARFLDGVTGDLTLGRNTTMPYWTTSRASGTPTAAKLAAGGVAVRFAALLDSYRLISDVVPILPGADYVLPLVLTAARSAGTMTIEPAITFYDGAMALDSGLTMDTFSFSASAPTQQMYNASKVAAPGTARYAKIQLTVTQTVAHNDSNRLNIHAVGLERTPPENLGGLDLLVSSVQASGALTAAAHLTGAGYFLASQAVAHQGVISPAALAANTNNWAPTDLNLAYLVRVGTDATPRTITGLDISVFALKGGGFGQKLWLTNRNAATVINFAHDSASSTAANRFYCPNNATFALNPRASVEAIYSATDSRWLLLGGNS